MQLLVAKLHDQCQSWLFQHPPDISPVDRAVALGHHEILDELFRIAPERWSIDAKLSSGNGNTALHLAAWLGQTRCVQSLCERGASVLCQNMALDTPLHFACRHGHISALKALLNAMISGDSTNCSSAGINTTNARELTPLLEAVQTGHDECVPLLLEAGATITGKSRPRRAHFTKKRISVDTLRVYHEKLASMPEPDSALVKALVRQSGPWIDSLVSRRQQIMNPQARSMKSCGGDPLWIACNLKFGITSDVAAQEHVTTPAHQLEEAA